MSLIDNLDNLKDNLWVYHTPLSIFYLSFKTLSVKKRSLSPLFILVVWQGAYHAPFKLVRFEVKWL
ncbi:hypothetical protein LP090_11460 [Moraxella bovis]|uniref:hypothetical protein n=1 Tax=Moraxella bovis TaxID=476 RepID=UPI002226844F|nr:hypothetical protein [Moraxella bovis]UZA44368.1 hypothetical protein LP090_11460 [Moraxella bovis]WAJ74965.1 hypothetical protein LP095_11550 [Moraxella bovis]